MRLWTRWLRHSENLLHVVQLISRKIVLDIWPVYEKNVMYYWIYGDDNNDDNDGDEDYGDDDNNNGNQYENGDDNKDEDIIQYLVIVLVEVADVEASAAASMIRRRSGVWQTVRSIEFPSLIATIWIQIGKTWAIMFEFLEASSTPDANADCDAIPRLMSPLIFCWKCINMLQTRPPSGGAWTRAFLPFIKPSSSSRMQLHVELGWDKQ